MDLSTARAIVTGGASGLGAATAQHFRDRGAEVTILDRDPAGEGFAASIGAGFAQTDVTDEGSVAAAVAQANAQLTQGEGLGPYGLVVGATMIAQIVLALLGVAEQVGAVDDVSLLRRGRDVQGQCRRGRQQDAAGQRAGDECTVRVHCSPPGGALE